MRTVICRSGIQGWRGNLQENYDSFEEFESYCENFGLHTRLGFETPKEAWDADPIVEGSTNPSDFRALSEEETERECESNPFVCHCGGANCEFYRTQDGTCADGNIARLKSCGGRRFDD